MHITDVIAAGISTQVAKATAYDYILSDWSSAGLRYPSLVRGRLLTIEQSLVRRVVGRLSAADYAALEERLISFLLSDAALVDYLLTHVAWTALPSHTVQALGEKSLQAALVLRGRGDRAIDLERLRAVLERC